MDDNSKKLIEYEEMLKDGIINEAEFEKLKEILYSQRTQGLSKQIEGYEVEDKSEKRDDPYKENILVNDIPSASINGNTKKSDIPGTKQMLSMICLVVGILMVIFDINILFSLAQEVYGFLPVMMSFLVFALPTILLFMGWQLLGGKLEESKITIIRKICLICMVAATVIVVYFLTFGIGTPIVLTLPSGAAYFLIWKKYGKN